MLLCFTIGSSELPTSQKSRNGVILFYGEINVLKQLGGFDMETVNAIIEQAEIRAEQMDT